MSCRGFLAVAALLLWALVAPLPATAAQEAAPGDESPAAEQSSQRERKTDDRFECVPPARDERGPEDLGFDQYALPLDPVVVSSQSEAPVSPSTEAGEGEEAPVAEVAPEEPPEEEFDAWREAIERYKARTGEFTSEVNRLIRRDFDEEIAELRGGYDNLVGRADLEERLLREQAIVAHEKFVEKHPDSPYTARRMFRLAELYFETSEEDFLAENDKYDELVDLFDAGKVDFLPEPPEKDYRRSIALYKKIVRTFPDYANLGAVYYMLGYAYSDEAGRHLDPQRAADVYRDLLANVSESEYRAQAYFRLGDLYFEENDSDLALDYYNQILAEFERRQIDEPLGRGEEKLYELALYKVAWSLYKLDRLDIAMDRFMELIDWAEAKEARTGRGADLKVESIRYLAISISDVATERGVSPIQPAVELLSGKGERAWVYEVLKELAGILRDQARFDEAIDAYVYLQQRYPLSPDGPEFQNNVIVLYSNLVPPDQRAAADARVALTNMYGLDSAWYESNKNNKTAIQMATQYILEALESVAFTYHQAALDSGEPADYLLAAKKYEEYLARYPFAKNAYELNYNLAECYFWIGRDLIRGEDGAMASGWERAIAQYSRLFGFPEDEYRKDAILGIMYSYNFIWKDREGGYKTNPAALANLRPPLGETVEYAPLAISELSVRYIQSVRWVERELTDFEELAVVLYDVGETFYYANYLDNAREVFNKIIEEFPATDYAAFAAGRIVDSYLYTGDLDQMRRSTERFAAMTLGDDMELAEERNLTFAGLARDSLFKEGEMAYETESFECALTSFLDYYDLYGDIGSAKDMQNIDLVVYNVAQAYSKLGRTDESNEYFELLLARFPESSQAVDTFWRMASNYERVLELEKAVGYYEDLLTYHPADDGSADALANAAFLKIGLKRFGDAANSFERYHDAYTDKKDSKDLLFKSAELWESAGNAGDARRVYRRWLKLYGEEDADDWVETQRKLADQALARGKTKEAEKIIQAIYDSYPSIKADLGGIGTRICAEIAFQPLRVEFEEYEKLQFPDSQDVEELQKVFDRKLEWNKEVAASFDTFVAEYNDFEWGSAAFYYKALSFKRHGETWLQAPIPYDPDDPDEEEYFYIYSDQLSAKAEPFEATAVQLLEQLVSTAKDKKRHNTWIDAALDELSRVDPNTYPVPKPERSTVIPSDTMTLPLPVEEVPEISTAPAAGSRSRFALAGSR